MTENQCEKCKELNEKLGYTEPENYEAVCDDCWDKRIGSSEKGDCKMNFSERMDDIEKFKKEPNYSLLWCRHGNWLTEQAGKVEKQQAEIEHLKFVMRKYHKYATQDFAKEHGIKL